MDTAIITGAELRAVGITQAPDGDYFVESWALGLILEVIGSATGLESSEPDKSFMFVFIN